MKRLLAVFGLIALSLPVCAQTANYPESQLNPAYAADTGSVNALVASVPSCPSALAVGQWFKVLPGHNSTSTTPTLNVCGFGAKTITKNGQSALVSGDLVTTEVAAFIWDGTDMELLNPNTIGGGVTSLSGSCIISNSSSTGAVTISWSGTSGGIVYFSSGSCPSSSAAMTTHGVMVGEGAGNAPTSTSAGGSNDPLLGGGASADPTFSSIAYPTSASTGCVVYALSSTGLSCNTNVVLSSGGAYTTYDGLSTTGLGLATVLGVSDVTAQTTNQTTVNLISSTAAAGHYLVRLYIDQNALCTTGTGQVYATVNWTDASHAHSSQTVTLTLANTAISTPYGFVDAAIPFWAASSSAITYTTTYTACATGTASYDLHAEVERTN